MATKGQFAKETFTGLPPMARGIIAVVATGAAIFVGYQIYKAIRRIGGKGVDETARDTVRAAENEYQKLLKQGQKLSFSTSAYAGANEAIAKLLDGCETLSSELSAIAEVIKVVRKPIDWEYLQQSFGQRDISNCGTFGTTKTRYSLSGLLKDQLDSFAVIYANYKLGGWTVPKGYYSDSINILEKYFAEKGIKF
jgi:hypothetical protein